MINRKYRISKAFFPKILKNPSISGAYLRIVVAPPISLKNPSFAVIIAKKQAKLAVTRNLFRRTIFKNILEHIDQFPHKSFIFILQKTPVNKKTITKEIKIDTEDLIIKSIKKYEKSS